MQYDQNSISYIAKTNFRNSNKRFGIKQRDRLFHIHILGKTGTGKTTLLQSLILQDIYNNRGCCVFDVVGDMSKFILNHIPEHRKGDLIHLDIANPNSQYGYNPLVKVSYEKRSLVASNLLNVFMNISHGAWGVKLEHILRNTLLTLLDQPRADMSDILKLLTDKHFRYRCYKHIENPEVLQFWKKEFP